MGNTKSFLFINTLYSPNIGGGAEIIMQIQAEGLVKMGYNVSVLTTSENKGLAVEVINGVKVYRAGIENFYWHYTPNKPNKLLRMAWHLRDIYNVQMNKYVKQVLEKEKPSNVFCHNIAGWSVAIYNEIKKHNIPIIQVLHDQYLRCPNSNMFKGDHACKSQCTSCRLMRLPHRKATEQLSAVVGVSDFVVSGLIEDGYFKNVPTYVINNARDLEINQEIVPVDDRPLRYGYLGTLAKAKGVEYLIEQFLTLDINATLVIGGRGDNEYESYLREKYKVTNITFLGYVKPSDFYESIDVSIVPSIWPDTFPGVAFEGPAYNVPVIASNIGGLPEIIKHELNGLLFDVNLPNTLSDAILRLHADRKLLNRLISECRASVAPFLSVERMLKEYITLCEEL